MKFHETSHAVVVCFLLQYVTSEDDGPCRQHNIALSGDAILAGIFDIHSTDAGSKIINLDL